MELLLAGIFLAGMAIGVAIFYAGMAVGVRLTWSAAGRDGSPLSVKDGPVIDQEETE